MTTITPEILLKAYAAGIFPMAESADDETIYWIDPDHRGIIPLEGFHIPRRLRRTVRARRFEVRVDTAFTDVLDACAQSAPQRPTTWINDRIRALYGGLHELGHCHSVECWRGGRLVGGLYGVSLGSAFFGESMFSRETDASKLALAHLADHLLRQGFTLFDAQFLTPHLARLGAIEVGRAEYHRQLAEALRRPADFAPKTRLATPQEVMQRRTQTS